MGKIWQVYNIQMQMILMSGRRLNFYNPGVIYRKKIKMRPLTYRMYKT